MTKGSAKRAFASAWLRVVALWRGNVFRPERRPAAAKRRAPRPGAAIALGLVAWLAGPGYVRAQPSATAVASAQAGPQVVVTDHVRLIFFDPHLEPLARRAAALAEEAVVRVAGLIGAPPFPITITLADRTDAFNALATPLPRPTVALRAVAPLDVDLGLRAHSWLELVILHEVAHLLHFRGTGPPATGLGFVGDGVAPPPPLWLVEGLATWVESELTSGGRRDDARTAGLLATLARGSSWPTLEEASTGSHDGWPGGATRYLLGAAFLQELVDAHGWDAIPRVLRAYAAAPPWRSFAGVWRDTTGTDLYEAWDAWRDRVERTADARAADLPPPPRPLTDTGWHTGLPVISSDGSRLAWRTWPAAVAVAELTPAGEALQGAERFLEGTTVESLDWLDDRTLVYTRRSPTAATAYADVYSLDVRSGAETRWTTEGRAHFVRAEPDPACVRFVRARPPAPPAVVRACRGGATDVLWAAAPGEEVVGFDVATDGRMAISLWDRGHMGIALLVPAEPRAGTPPDSAPGFEPRFLTWDRYRDLDPVWTPRGTIRFRSDRTERFEIWEVDSAAAAPGGASLTRWTATAGGAFQPASQSVMVVLQAAGYDLARVPEDPIATAQVPIEPREPIGQVALGPPAVAYEPWSTLAPFGWLPTAARVDVVPLGLALEVQAHGQDASAQHAWALTAGVDTALQGVLGPVYGNVRYVHAPAGGFSGFEMAPARTWSVEVGSWPHAVHLAATTETALGIGLDATARTRGDGWAGAASLRVGVVHLSSAARVRPEGRFSASWSSAGADRWGYGGAGARFGLQAVATPVAAGWSSGAWIDGTARAAALGGSVGVAIRAGYRQPPPVPLALDAFAVTASVSGRWHVPVGLRLGDGRYALERVTVEPAGRAWAHGASLPGSPFGGTAAQVGYGADVAVGADLLVSYAAPVTLTVQGGWSDRWWFATRVGFPF